MSTYVPQQGDIVRARRPAPTGKVVSSGMTGRVLGFCYQRNPYAPVDAFSVFWFGGVGHGSGWTADDLELVKRP